MLPRSSISVAALCWLSVMLAVCARAQEPRPVETAEPRATLSSESVQSQVTRKAKPTIRKAAPHTSASHMASPPHGRLSLVQFEQSPFPYDGLIPETGGMHFLDNDAKGPFHLSPRGGKLYEAVTYRDQRTLLYIPARFRLSRPNPAIVLFLHGNLATLAHDVVARQKVPQQLEASGLNTVLVAPQLAVDALDSSAGRFWTPGFLGKYLDEAADRISQLSDHTISADALREVPVIVVAYSGGYLAAAFSLKYDLMQTQPRIKGVILLDALFGEEPKFADWVEQTRPRTFFVSAYSDASRTLNTQLAKTLADQQVKIELAIPRSIGPGTVVFKAVPGAIHNDFVTRAWGEKPLQDILRRIDVGQKTPPAP